MPFTSNARYVHLDNDKLHANLQKKDGSWNEASFDFNTLIGNDYGKFSIPGKNFLKSTYDFDIEAREDKATATATTFLTAFLYVDGDGSSADERELVLDGFLTNDDGEFNGLARRSVHRGRPLRRL